MSQNDEEVQKKKLEEIRKQEEEELAEVLSQTRYSIPYINLAGVLVENDALRTVPEDLAKNIEVAPFKLLGHDVHIAVRAPERDEVLALKKELEAKGYNVHLYMASPASLHKVWERYQEISMATTSRQGGLDITGEAIIDIGKRIHTINDVPHVIDEMSKDASSHRISKMLEVILAGAISIGASDIHIEPEEGHVRLRYRLDGLLQDIMEFPFEIHKFLNSRIKLLSGLKLVNDIAQDGRFSIFIEKDEISIRTSLIPGAYGESIVMRILNPKSIQVQLEDLGIEPRLFEVIQKEIIKPNGLILLNGPTGSGKTTTLYAFLRRIYSPEIKIITIEDPIEYHLPGITQTQVETDKGYTFLEGLRSALRQDPDVIMVGEIRDSETAKIAVESALTGHMVFSTLHTNNAAGVIPRLIDLDVNPKILTSALSLSIAQRLVRKLCAECKKERAIKEDEDTVIRKILTDAQTEGKDLSFYGIDMTKPFTLYSAPGCDKCNNTGFKGRLGIYEAIVSDEKIEEIIPQNPSEREIKKVGDKQGILDMKEDGIIKALKGITSLEEVKSVVDLEQN